MTPPVAKIRQHCSCWEDRNPAAPNWYFVVASVMFTVSKEFHKRKLESIYIQNYIGPFLWKPAGADTFSWVRSFNFNTKHKQDYFRNSFFIRTVELWNTLPSHVKSSNSLSIFKSHLHKLYSTKLSHYVPPGTAWSASTHCDLLNHASSGHFHHIYKYVI